MPDDPRKRPDTRMLKTALNVVRDLNELQHSPRGSQAARNSAKRLRKSLDKLNKYANKKARHLAGGIPTDRSPVAGIAGGSGVRIQHYRNSGRDKDKYNRVIRAAKAEELCNAYGISVLEDGDWDNVLEAADGLFVAHWGRSKMGILIYCLPGDNGYPTSWGNELYFYKQRANGNFRPPMTASKPEVAAAMKAKVGARYDAKIFEVMVACKELGKDRQVMTLLMEAFTNLLSRGDVIYAGATTGQNTPRGRHTPTAAWRRLGFSHLDTIKAFEDGNMSNGYEQNVMVMKH